jgi:hypothetical protein
MEKNQQKNEKLEVNFATGFQENIGKKLLK